LVVESVGSQEGLLSILDIAARLRDVTEVNHPSCHKEAFLPSEPVVAASPADVLGEIHSLEVELGPVVPANASPVNLLGGCGAGRSPAGCEQP
jgi:hypothetical protein